MSFGFRTLSVFRYVNWAILKEKSTNFSFMFVNTHFDNSGVNKDPSALLFNERIVALAKDIPMVVVNHTYSEIGLFPKQIVSGGTGLYYSADNIFIIGRQQEKDGTEIVGYNFIINVEKSRYVKEKSKIPISVSFDGGRLF